MAVVGCTTTSLCRSPGPRAIPGVSSTVTSDPVGVSSLATSAFGLVLVSLGFGTSFELRNMLTKGIFFVAKLRLSRQSLPQLDSQPLAAHRQPRSEGYYDHHGSRPCPLRHLRRSVKPIPLSLPRGSRLGGYNVLCQCTDFFRESAKATLSRRSGDFKYSASNARLSSSSRLPGRSSRSDHSRRRPTPQIAQHRPNNRPRG